MKIGFNLADPQKDLTKRNVSVPHFESCRCTVIRITKSVQGLNFFFLKSVNGVQKD